MPFPKRPRGEQPITTIRWQRRQMEQMEQELMNLRTQLTRSELRAGDLALRVDLAEEALFKEQEKFETHKHEFTGYRAQAEKDKHATELELAYLRGYHERSKEVVVQSQTNRNIGSTPGNPGYLQDGRQATTPSQEEVCSQGTLCGHCQEIRDHGAHRSEYPVRAEVDAYQMTEAHDPIRKQF